MTLIVPIIAMPPVLTKNAITEGKVTYVSKPLSSILTNNPKQFSNVINRNGKPVISLFGDIGDPVCFSDCASASNLAFVDTFSDM